MIFKGMWIQIKIAIGFTGSKKRPFQTSISLKNHYENYIFELFLLLGICWRLDVIINIFFTTSNII